jgi:hypothetical protein
MDPSLSTDSLDERSAFLNINLEVPGSIVGISTILETGLGEERNRPSLVRAI